MSYFAKRSEIYDQHREYKTGVPWREIAQGFGDNRLRRAVAARKKLINDGLKNMKKIIKQDKKEDDRALLKSLKTIDKFGVLRYNTGIGHLQTYDEFTSAQENINVVTLNKDNNLRYIIDNLKKILSRTLASLLKFTIVYVYYNDSEEKYSIHYITKTFDLTAKRILENLHVGFDSIGSEFFITKLATVISSESNFNNYAKKLKAFSPNSDRQFHKETACSTTQDRLCIYQTFFFLYIEKEGKLISKTARQIKESLDNESINIKKFIRKGELVNFLINKSKETEETYYVKFFKGSTPGFSVTNDTIKKITDINDFGDKIFLYDSGHVAPHLNNKRTEIEDKKPTQKIFSLRPQEKKKFKEIGDVISFDFETYTDLEFKANPFCLCLSNGMNYYGNNANKIVSSFCDYLDTIVTKVYMNKHLPSTAIKQILIYGFNNSRFDNIFILKELKKRNPSLKTIIMGNSIKMIKYHNIRFFDINCYYSESLSSVAKNFNIEEQKGVFPYKFPNKNNLEYIGDVPELKYWNSEEDRETYIKENGDIFNLKEYTIKYCLLDAKLCNEIAKRHLTESYGKINNKNFDVRLCPTGASSALKLFNQVFQKKTLYESPSQILLKERLAFHGGRTEVFKRNFQKNENNDHLKYYDINSSYPFSMTSTIPFKYIRSFTLTTSKKIRDDQIIDYFLYKASIKYTGNEKFFIPNIIFNDSKGNLLSVKESGYNYHWGVELREAIKNDCDVHIDQINEYEGTTELKDFAEYFYNERLKIKKTNQSKAEFYKLTMNSLYGKFGQKIKNNSVICNSIEEISEILSNPKNKLHSFEEYKDFVLVNYNSIDDQSRSIGNLIRISSYITACSRTNLSKIMRHIGHKHIYYCDTDSIFTDKNPDIKFIDNSKLGAWKCEDDKIISAKFLAPKSYTYTSESGIVRKAKGMPKKLVNDKLFKDEHAVIKIDNMFFRSLDSVHIKPQTRTFNPVMNKRVWNGNNSVAYATAEKVEEAKKTTAYVNKLKKELLAENKKMASVAPREDIMYKTEIIKKNGGSDYYDKMIDKVTDDTEYPGRKMLLNRLKRLKSLAENVEDLTLAIDNQA